MDPYKQVWIKNIHHSQSITLTCYEFGRVTRIIAAFYNKYKDTINFNISSCNCSIISKC